MITKTDKESDKMSSTISYNFKRYKKQAVTAALSRHYGKERAIRNHSNQSIDTSKTHRNIIFVEAEEGMRQKALNRIAVEKERNPKLRVRSDSNILLSASVSVGGDMANESEEKKLEFLREAYEYLRDRFGGENGENIVNAEIHLDETNPHLHFNFVPIFEINGSTRLNTDPVWKPANKAREHVLMREHMNGIANGRWLFEKKEEVGPSGLPLKEYKVFTAMVEQEVDKQVGEAKDELRDRTMDVVNREKAVVEREQRVSEGSRQLQMRATKLTFREKDVEKESKAANKANDEAKARMDSVNQSTRELNERIERYNQHVGRMREKERAQREKEDMLNEKEVALKERETLLESATRALSDFKRKVGEFTQNVRNAFKWAENRKSEDDKQKVLSINAKFEEKVVEPTLHIFDGREIDPTTLIDDLKQPTQDANDLISDLEVYQPSALER